MHRVKISLNSIQKVKTFNKLISTVDCDVDLTYGRYTIDAKSIMGIFSIDISKPVNMVIHSDNADEIESILELIEAFIIKE